MQMRQKSMFFISGLACILMVCAGYVLESFGFQPCKLCMIERYILLTQGILTLFAWSLWSHNLGLWLGVKAVFVAMIGTVVAGYHTGVQYKIFAPPSFCQVVDAHTLEDFMRSTHVACDKRVFDILSIPAAAYLFIWFLACVTLTSYALKKRRFRGP